MVLTVSICTLFMIIGIGNAVILQKETKEITLAQLQANSHRQMMGYIIKTSTGKVIAVDGGTSEDEENLIKHINSLGGKVDVWFITHPHNDHTGAFIKIVEDINKNGLFDTGDYFLNQQPETIFINTTPIKLLAGWEIENEWIVK